MKQSIFPLRRALLPIAALLCCTAGAKAQGVIVFDDFLFDNGGNPGENLNGPVNPGGFLLWNIRDGSVDLVGGGLLEPIGNLLGRYVDLGGSTNDSGIFAYAQPLTLLPGVSYTLSFRYNSVDGQPNQMRVTLGGQSILVSSATTEFATFQREFTFAEAISFLGLPLQPITESPLSFEDLGNDTAGIGIDQVILRPTIVSTEPFAGIQQLNGRIVVNFSGTLQSSGNLETFTDVQLATSPYVVPQGSPASQFFRARATLAID